MSKPSRCIIISLLLTGCQGWPFGSPIAADGIRLQARTGADTQATLQPMPEDQRRALDSLDANGYIMGYMPMSMANATFTLDTVPYEGSEKQLEGVVFSDYMAALAAAQRNGVTSAVPSLNLIDGVCKQLNDGVYARLELLWEQQQAAPLRKQLLTALVSAWTTHPDDPQWQAMLARVALAARLAGETPELPAAMQARVDQELATFEQDEARSKPLGFYTLTDDLKRTYRSDRALQTLVYLGNPATGIQHDNVREAALARSLVAKDPTLGQALDHTGSFYQRMANPFRAFSPTTLPLPLETDWAALADNPERRTAFYDAASAAKGSGMLNAYGFIPPSGSVEDALFDKAPPNEPDLMAYLIREIKAGTVSLAPTPASGFYQYQEFALEALLTPEKQPEGRKIHFGDAYLKRLEEAFKTGLAKARETQVKQTCWMCSEPTSVPPPPPKPRMFVEPIGTVYKRYGDMYAFLERQVLPLFPAESLDAAHPLDESGEGTRSVRAQVAYARQLMYGLYLVSADQLGLDPEGLTLEAKAQSEALAAAKAWLAGYQADPLIAMDTRVAVPIRQNDDADPLVTYWGTAGVTMVKLQFNFDKLPLGTYGTPEPATYFVAADKFLTFTRRRSKGLLDRAGYRAILDGAKTLGEATHKLEGS